VSDDIPCNRYDLDKVFSIFDFQLEYKVNANDQIIDLYKYLCSFNINLIV
jgi:hypothetical protein